MAYADQPRRFAPTTMQTQQREAAIVKPAQRAKSQQGRPAVFATQHAGHFDGPHAVRKPAVANSRMAAPKSGRQNAPHAKPSKKQHRNQSD